MQNDDNHMSQTAKSFEKVLNSHGYGFQYSVLKEAERLARERKSRWGYSVFEFPVEVQGAGTRIDFVLKNHWRSLYMIAECKRANPALSNWCFTKVPEWLLGSSVQSVFVETAQVLEHGPVRMGTEHLFHSSNIYHTALEVKSGDKGDVRGKGRGAIEEAAAQVCRGSNGLINFFEANPTVFEGERKDKRVVGFLPVIFTTANLWASDVDLSQSNLEQGKIDLSSTNIERKSWLFYHYHQSPGLKHSVRTLKEAASLEEILYNDYVRTIAIVNATGVADFLCLNPWTI